MLVDCKNNAIYKNENYRKDRRSGKGRFEGIPIYQSTYINLEMWQITLACMSSLKGSDAI